MIMAEGAKASNESERVPPPPVFFVRVANKGLMLDAASRLANIELKVVLFSGICEWSVRVANKGVTARYFCEAMRV
jgi:hypothetical protein